MKRNELFKYEVKNNSVFIREFIGNKNAIGRISIPSKIDGLKVVFLSSRTFKGCGFLTEVEIPETVLMVEPSIFTHCPNLRNIEVHPANPIYRVEDGVLFENHVKLHLY